MTERAATTLKASMTGAFFVLALALAMLTLNSKSARAQVVTPTYDPTQPILFPMAAELRYIKGENESDDKRTATLSYSIGSGKGQTQGVNSDWDASRSGFLMLAKTDNINIELSKFTDSVSINSALYECVSPLDFSSCATGIREVNATQTQMNFSYKKSKVVYAGHYRIKETGGSIIAKETGAALGASYRFKRKFFVGAGLETVKMSLWDTPALSWSNFAWGAGLMTGKPKETQVRLEYANIRSSDARESNGYTASWHPPQDTTYLSAEVKLNNLFFGYRSENYQVREWGSSPSRTRHSNIYSLGWIPSKGIIASARVTNHVYDKNSSSESSDDQLGFSLGYNF